MITSQQSVTGLPEPANRYHADVVLQKLLGGLLSREALAWAEPVLTRTGQASAGPLDELATLADAHPPVLHTRDRFGNRVDHIEYHPAYRRLQDAAYGEGIIGHYYDANTRKVLGDGREVAKFAQGYLFSQAEQGLYCPVCMTDGTAYLIETFGSPEQKLRYLPRLTAHDVDQLWDGAMFLTEKAGGSDVGAVETVARPRSDGRYTLHGEKWFCSNASAELAMVLARPEGAPEGTRGLGLFLLKRHDDAGHLNGLHLERLKNKLGTRSMPTGEVILDGSVVEPVGELSRGFVQMMQMVNLSRLYNATASLAVVRRAFTESLRWAEARLAFGRPLVLYPMVRSTLADMAVELEAAMHLLFTTVHRRGRMLEGSASAEDQRLLRLLTPLAKFSTARLAVHAASEAIEMHGGNGYVEDWPLARLLRDAQVLPIWEGSANVLVLDAFRAIRKEQAHETFFEVVRRGAQSERSVLDAADALERALQPLLQDASDSPLCRVWCERAVQVYQASLLLAAASDARAQAVADAYTLRHFGARRDPLAPAHLQHDASHFETLVGLR